MQEPEKANMRLAGLCGGAVQPGHICLHQAQEQRPEHAVHARELGAGGWVLPSQAVDCAQGMLFMHGQE